jgi:catechol 2,3-dioxygenase-like lactoylglutathione lyase family enzyme
MATIRYLVSDVEAAVAFYRDRLGFQEDQRFGPAMAIMRRGDLALWLAGPASSAARPLPDGAQPEPGGWNRFVIEVDDIDAIVAALRDAGCRFRGGVVSGPGGRQVVVDDPSGNPVEIFAPR